MPPGYHKLQSTVSLLQEVAAYYASRYIKTALAGLRKSSLFRICVNMSLYPWRVQVTKAGWQHALRLLFLVLFELTVDVGKLRTTIVTLQVSSLFSLSTTGAARWMKSDIYCTYKESDSIVLDRPSVFFTNAIVWSFRDLLCMKVYSVQHGADLSSATRSCAFQDRDKTLQNTRNTVSRREYIPIEISELT